MSARAARVAFSPRWLDERLKALLPGFPDVSLCVALSGGVDSTALLAALATRRRRRPALRAINIDHGLHANSPKWSAHCRAFANSVGVPLEVLNVEVARGRGESLEAVARDARYRVLAAALAKDEVLLTGHHEDDQLETVLLQLFRGSGLAGIAAMPELTRFAGGWLCRPLLTMTRASLQAWARSRKLGWVEDDSNANEAFDRNYLRRQILPLVRSRWPAVGTSVARSARHAAEGQRLLEGLGFQDAQRAADGDSLRVPGLRALPLDRRRNALRSWIGRLGAPIPDTRRLEEICGPLLDARDDAHPRVAWGGVFAQREDGRLSIRSGGDSVVRGPVDSGVAIHARSGIAGSADRGVAGCADPGVAVYAEVTWLWRTAQDCALRDGRGKLELRADAHGPLDLDALPEVLTIRGRRGGERLRLRAGGPSRALKSLLQEAHVPVIERARLPLLYSGERLLLVADLWHDESVQARPGCRRGRLRWQR